MKKVIFVLFTIISLSSVSYGSVCSNCKVTEVNAMPSRDGFYIKLEGTWTFNGGEDCRSTVNTKMFFVPGDKLDSSKAHSVAIAAMIGKRNIRIAEGITNDCTSNTFYETLNYIIME